MPEARRAKHKRYTIPSEIDPEGFRCIQLQIPDSDEYAQLLASALRELGHWQNYTTTGDNQGRRVGIHWQEVFRAVDWSGDGCVIEQPEESGCYEIGAFHPAVTYWPNNPILEPFEDQADYGAVVWNTGSAYTLANEHDAVINPLAFLQLNIGQMLSVGLPSWTLSFEGSGQIDVRFVSQFFGGAAWVFPDGNPLLGDLVSLDYIDLLELASVQALLTFFEVFFQNDDQTSEVIESFNFDTEGPHTLTAWYLPTAGADPPFGGVGGGVRGFKICGDIILDSTTTEGLVVDIRLNGSLLEKLVGGEGEWEPVIQVAGGVADVYERHNRNNFRVGNDVEGSAYIQTRFYGSGSVYHQMYNAAGTRVTREAEQGTRIQKINYLGGWLWQASESGATLDITYYNRILAASHSASGGGSWVPKSTLHVITRNGSDVPMIVERRNTSPIIVAFWDGDENEVARVGASGDMWASEALGLQGRTSTDALAPQAALIGGWLDDTHAVRAGSAQIVTMSASEAIQNWNSHGQGGVSHIGVHGNTPIQKPTIAQAPIHQILASVVQALTDYGWVNGAGLVIPPVNVPGGVDPGDVPDSSTPEPLCNSANYLATEIIALCQRILDLLATLSDADVVIALVLEFGISVPLIQAVVAAIEVAGGGAQDLIDEMTENYDELVCRLYQNELNKSDAKEWVLSEFSPSSAARAILAGAIDAISDGQWLLWASLGAAKPGSYDCSGCYEDCTEYDFSIGKHGWLPFDLGPNGSVDAVYELGVGFAHGPNDEVGIGREFDPGISPTSVSIFLSEAMDNGGDENINQYQIALYAGGTMIYQGFQTDNTPEYAFTGLEAHYSVPITGIAVAINVSGNQSYDSPQRIIRVVIECL